MIDPQQEHRVHALRPAWLWWCACLLAASCLPAAADPQGSPAALPSKAALNTAYAAQGAETEAVVLDLPADDSARVVVRANETAAISSEVNARIVYLPKREGDRFKKGELLVEFDCRRFAAEHDAAEAAMKAYEAAYQNQLKLLEYKSTGTTAVDQAFHQFERSKAELRGFAVRIESCKILAPFDGRMIEKVAQVHEIAQPNQPLIKILNEENLDLVLMVPSAWLPYVDAGQRFTVRIDETGEEHEARILQTTGAIDPVSQSVRVIAELTRPASTVLAGMSGTATFPQLKAEK